MTSAFAQMETEGGSGDYLKLTAGEVVTFHILSEAPEKAVIHWVNKKKTTCLGKDCELCFAGDRPKKRWTISVWDRKEKKVKKLEFGSLIAGQIKGIAEMLGENNQTVKDTDIRIKTTGSGLETEYSVLHVPPVGEIPKDILNQFTVPF